jgi:hypothetical protein
MDKNLGLKIILEEMQLAAIENNEKEMEILNDFFEKVYWKVYNLKNLSEGNEYDHCRQSFLYSIKMPHMRYQFLEEGHQALEKL